MSIESTCTPSCLVTASHISPGPGRRSALWLATGLVRTCSGWPTCLLSPRDLLRRPQGAAGRQRLGEPRPIEGQREADDADSVGDGMRPGGAAAVSARGPSV